MKTTGITRRIDDLGRVVIPKEIRKKLHFKEGELLEILLSENDDIILKKYSVLTRNDEFLKYYINSLKKILNCDIFIADLNKIIFSTVESLEENEIKGDLSKDNDIAITDNLILKDKFKIIPLIPEGDLIGYIVFYNYNSNLNLDLINFTTILIQHFFE